MINNPACSDIIVCGLVSCRLPVRIRAIIENALKYHEANI